MDIAFEYAITRSIEYHDFNLERFIRKTQELIKSISYAK